MVRIDYQKSSQLVAIYVQKYNVYQLKLTEKEKYNICQLKLIEKENLSLHNHLKIKTVTFHKHQ